MTAITPPYADPGRASFQVLDNYLANYLLAGNDPELAAAYSFPLAINTSFAQFSVVGLTPAGTIAMATYSASAAATGALRSSSLRPTRPGWM